jgi:hypothetical protein
MHPPGKRTVSASALLAAGVDVEALFAGAPSVRRRICSVGPRTTVVELEDRDVALPLSFVPPASDGQWLKFSRQGDDVDVSIDLQATLEGELRLSELMGALFGSSPQRRAS